nr:Rad52/Rad22 family DNA repair protein [Synechococcus sp. 1G10]
MVVGGIVREGCGVGHGIDVDLGQAHESALKEAETDAMKRALMTFGNPFGLALYDKQQCQQRHAVDPSQPLACRPNRQRLPRTNASRHGHHPPDPGHPAGSTQAGA